MNLLDQDDRFTNASRVRHLLMHSIGDAFSNVNPDHITSLHEPQAHGYSQITLGSICVVKELRVQQVWREWREIGINGHSAESLRNSNVVLDVTRISAADEDPSRLRLTHSS